jgi:hypothetical protein
MPYRGSPRDRPTVAAPTASVHASISTSARLSIGRSSPRRRLNTVPISPRRRASRSSCALMRRMRSPSWKFTLRPASDISIAVAWSRMTFEAAMVRAGRSEQSSRPKRSSAGARVADVRGSTVSQARSVRHDGQSGRRRHAWAMAAANTPAPSSQQWALLALRSLGSTIGTSARTSSMRSPGASALSSSGRPAVAALRAAPGPETRSA